jgi:hypothetical protein
MTMSVVVVASRLMSGQRITITIDHVIQLIFLSVTFDECLYSFDNGYTVAPRWLVVFVPGYHERDWVIQLRASKRDGVRIRAVDLTNGVEGQWTRCSKDQYEGSAFALWSKPVQALIRVAFQLSMMKMDESEVGPNIPIDMVQTPQLDPQVVRQWVDEPVDQQPVLVVDPAAQRQGPMMMAQHPQTGQLYQVVGELQADGTILTKYLPPGTFVAPPTNIVSPTMLSRNTTDGGLNQVVPRIQADHTLVYDLVPTGQSIVAGRTIYDVAQTQPIPYMPTLF